MTSPNEPGHPRSGDGRRQRFRVRRPRTPGSTGNATGRDVPPWQRGPAAARAAQNAAAPHAAGAAAARSRTAAAPAIRSRARAAERPTSTGSSPAGRSAPAAAPESPEPAPPRTERASADRGLRQRAARPVRWSSAARTAQGRRPSAASHRRATAAHGRVQVAARAAAGAGAGEHADPPDRSVERAEGLAGAVGRAVLRVDDRRRVPVPGARRHGRVEQAQQQRGRPAHQRERQAAASWCPAERSSAARR